LCHRSGNGGRRVAEADVTRWWSADDDAVLDICLGIDGALASVAKGAVLAT